MGHHRSGRLRREDNQSEARADQRRRTRSTASSHRRNISPLTNPSPKNEPFGSTQFPIPTITDSRYSATSGGQLFPDGESTASGRANPRDTTGAPMCTDTTGVSVPIGTSGAYSRTGTTGAHSQPSTGIGAKPKRSRRRLRSESRYSSEDGLLRYLGLPPG